jgi:uncharacterized Zn finger protein (UPF0148 family)
MVVATKKSELFTLLSCPGCGNKFKVLRGQAIDLPDACPICQERAEPQATPADNTIVMNQKTINRLASDLARQGAQIRRIESDLKSVLSALAMDSTALNTDVPDATKRIPEPPQEPHEPAQT